MNNHRFASQILREYDIRGTVGETLSVADAYALGRSFGTLLARKDGRLVCVGYDGRVSSPELEASLVKGLCDAGMQVLRSGLGPTPSLYFATKAMHADGGIMVTGSHNPPTHNGFKMMMWGASFWGGDIQEIGRIAAAGDWVSGEGSVRDVPLMDAYVTRLRADYTATRGLKVAWDAGNGSAGEAMQALTAMLPGTHILLNEDIDGSPIPPFRRTWFSSRKRWRRKAAISASPSTATATASAWSTGRGVSCGATSCCPSMGATFWPAGPALP